MCHASERTREENLQRVSGPWSFCTNLRRVRKHQFISLFFEELEEVRTGLNNDASLTGQRALLGIATLNDAHQHCSGQRTDNSLKSHCPQISKSLSLERKFASFILKVVASTLRCLMHREDKNSATHPFTNSPVKSFNST